MDALSIIFGLGNPGREYASTRHNAGFLVVERLAERWRSGWVRETRFKSSIGKAERGGQKVVLCRPETFMNLSGEAVLVVSQYLKVPLGRLLVVVDDADLALGQLRLRPGGSAGGHHGLESVERHLGTRDYARLRVGIGRESGGRRDIAGYVLAGFDASETALVGKVLERAADQVECWLASGLEKAMSQFNGAVEASIAKDK